MIAYFKNQDVSVEVPDDISDGDLADMQANFSHYVSQDSSADSVAPKKTTPDYFAAHIQPAIDEIGGLGIDLAGGPANFSGDTSRGKAFGGKEADQLSFGLLKPVTDRLKDDYERHPFYSAAGEATGAVGSLMGTGAVLKMAGVADAAVNAAGASAKLAAELPRFVAPAIESGATFGTHAFIKKTVESFQNGGVDVADFGTSVITDTALGMLAGGLSGFASPVKAVAGAAAAGATATAIEKKGPIHPSVGAAAGLGFVYSQMEGGDLAEAGLNAAVWGLFELVGSFGREERLRRASLSTLSDSIGEYIQRKNPEADPSRAKKAGQAIVIREARKATGQATAEAAIDAIVKDGPEGTLGFIEKINQDIRNSHIPTPEPKTPRIEGESGLPADVKKPSQPIALPEEIKALMGPEVSKAVDQALNPPQSEPTPNFKTTDEAVAYGQSISGDSARIEALKKEYANIETQRQELKGVRAKAQERLNLAVKGQFLREAFQAAEESSKNNASDEPKIVSQSFQGQQVFNVVNKDGSVLGTYNSEEAARASFSGAQKTEPKGPKALRAPINAGSDLGAQPETAIKFERVPENSSDKKKSIHVVFLSHKAELESLIEDIKSIEPTRYGPARDSEGNVVKHRVKLSGYTPEHLAGMDIEKASDLPLIQKAINGEPLTAKQHNRVASMLEKKYEQMAKDAAAGMGPGQDTGDNVDPEGAFYDKPYQSSKSGQDRNYGDPGDEIQKLHKSLGGMEYIKKMEGPELIKFAKEISGHTPTVEKMLTSLGYFQPGTQKIAISRAIFDNPDLWQAVLRHEIGHLMDFSGEKTMARGNILGRLASLVKYRKSLLPHEPGSDPILTDADRERFRREAEKIAAGQAEKASGQKTMLDPEAEAENAFDPQAILDIWNKATGDIDKGLLDYVKGLDAAAKKALVVSAFKALKTGEKITIDAVKKFNKQVSSDPGKVADIYKDLLKKEILKRKLWEEEVITQELKNFTQYWKPFDDTRSPGFTKYRYSSAELYADFISGLLTAPAKVMEIAPNAFKAFFNYLQNKPDVMKSLLELQALVQGADEDLQAARYDDILKMFEKNDQAFRQRQSDIEDAKKSTWDILRVLFWDNNSILLDERNKLKKSQGLPPEQDGQYAIEKNSAMAAFVRSHLWDFDNAVYKPAIAEDLLKPVKAILFLDRVGADRENLANPKGYTPKTSKEVLDDLEKRDPVKFQRANELAQNARDWFKKLTEIPGAEDFFSPEQIFTIGTNDKYAPFRVTKYAADYVSAGFANQYGTFEDIGDPLTSLVMKGVSTATAVERNRLKKVIGEMLLKSGAMMRPAKVTTHPKFHIEEPSERHLGTIAWKEGGKWVAYHTDKFIADTLKTESTEKIGLIGAAINTMLGNKFFRGSYITFSLGFQGTNLIKDFMSTWKNTPGMTIGKAFKLYAEALPHAKARAAGLYDPLIQEMERNGALQVTFNDLILGRTSEDRELESVLEKFVIIEGKENKYKGVPVAEQISAIADAIRYSGDVIETLSKVAGYKALENMSPEERAHFVRNFAGTPNYKRKGLATPVTNAIWMFSNIWKEGLRNLIDIGFTNEKTRGSFWTKTIVSTILAKVLMALVAAGYLGKHPQEIMGKSSEYLKSNYIVLPIGIDGHGNGVLLTIPQDESSRLIGGLFWKMLHHNGDLKKNLADILAFGSGQAPGPAPGAVLISNWLTFLSGGNPRDPFRQQDILTDQEASAGGKYAFEPMVRWTLNETGLVNIDVHDTLKNEPIYKTAESMIPILNRLIRITKQGERETASNAAKDVKKQEDRASLDMKEKAREAIKKGESEAKFIALAKTPEDAQKMSKVFNSLKKGLTDDPYVQTYLRTTSNAQKVAVLKEAFATFPTKEKSKEYLQTLWKNGIVSDEVYNQAFLEIKK